jgi:hypothetical protein
MKAKHPHGPPMTLGNMRKLGVNRLLVACLNLECLHTALLDVAGYQAEIAVPSFGPRMVCSACGSRIRMALGSSSSSRA